MRFAVVMSRFNSEVTEGLLRGAREVLSEAGHPLRAEDFFEAPGAFELPLLAKELARTGRYDGVVVLGCVIKGDTAHFEFISLGAAMGLQMASLETGVPLSFGVLTTYTDEQAEVRAASGTANKGREAAQACLEAAQGLAKIRASR